jgi:type II secretory pathway pseudopilin PulG
MGKALLIIAFAAVLGGSVIMLQTQNTERQTENELANAGAEFLAREAARSGYEVGMGEARLDFSSRAARLGVSTPPVEQGRYDLTVEQTDDATLVVTSTGHADRRAPDGSSERAAHALQGELVRLVEAPSAVVLDAEEVIPLFLGEAFAVSGEDRRPLGTASRSADAALGVASETHAMLGTQPGIAAILKNELTDGQAQRVRGLGDAAERGAIAEGANYPATLRSIYDEAMARVRAGTGDVVSYIGDRTFSGSETFGSSPVDPKIVHVDGNAVIRGQVRGHGILIVEGDLTIEGLSSEAADNFAWEGLVFARDDGEVSYTQTGATRIDGALVVQAPPLQPIDFEIDEDGNVTVGDRFYTRVEVLGAAMSNYNVTVEVAVGGESFSPWGAFSDGKGSDVNGTSGELPEFVADRLFDSGSTVRVTGRSWDKVHGSWVLHRERTNGTASHSDYVKVLRDGDLLPNVHENGQLDVSDFISDYVEGDRVALDDNQVIYLYELGRQDVTYGDYQDLVVLVTLLNEEELVSGTEVADGCTCKQANKVAIVHYPPGNPSNAHVICVGSPAVTAHVTNHSDTYCTEASLEEIERGAGTGDGAAEALSLVNFTLGGAATVQYSAEAIGRVATHLQSAQAVALVESLKQRSFDPEQPYEHVPTWEPREREAADIAGDAPVTACVDGVTQTITVAQLQEKGESATLGPCAYGGR